MDGKGVMKFYEDGRISNIQEGIFSRNRFVKSCKVSLKKPPVEVAEDVIEEQYESDDEYDPNEHAEMVDRFQFYNCHIL